MGFSRQEYWSGLPYPSPGDLPYPGIKPMSVASLALAGGFFTTSATWDAATWELSNSSRQADFSLRCNNCRNEDNWQQNIIVMEGNQVSLESMEEPGKSRGCLIIWCTGLSETYWVGPKRLTGTQLLPKSSCWGYNCPSRNFPKIQLETLHPLTFTNFP